MTNGFVLAIVLSVLLGVAIGYVFWSLLHPVEDDSDYFEDDDEIWR